MFDPACASDLLSLDSIDDPTLLTEEDATAMGGAFAGILHSGRTATPALSPAEAVRKLTEAFAALDIMGRKHVWFLPMLRTIAQRLLGMSIVDSVRRASRSSSVIRPTDGVRRASRSNAVRPVPLGLSSFDVVVRADPYYTFRVYYGMGIHGIHGIHFVHNNVGSRQCSAPCCLRRRRTMLSC
jgi:hypothetical protein